MGAYPLILSSGKYRQLNDDIELPATRVIQFPDGAATMSDANKGKIRYNNVSKTFQLSVDGGAFGDIVTGSLTDYAYLPGRAGGQTLIGGTAATDDMILRATAGVGASGSDIIFQVGNNGGTEAMRILYDGKVGIGIAAPTFALHVASTGSPGKISKTTPDNNIYEVLQLEAFTTNFFDIGQGLGPAINFNIAGNTSSTRTIAQIYAYMNWGTTHGELVFCTADGGAPVEHLRISREGYVGVNTGAIDTLYNGIFTVRSVASNNLMLKEVSWDAVGPQIIFEKRRSDYDRVYDGDVLGRMDFQGYRGGNHSHAAEISVSVDGAYNWNIDDMPGAIYFKTSPLGSGTPLSRMVIKNNGYIGIGTITPSSILEVSSNGALTNTTIPLQTYSHTTSGVAAAGFGIKNAVNLENAATTSVEALSETVTWSATAAGPHDYAKYVAQIRVDAGLQNAIVIDGAGGTVLTGFQAAATAAVSDVTLASLANRSAGDLLRVDNVAATKFSVSFNGSITSTGAQTVSVKGIDDGDSPYTVAADAFIVSVNAVNPIAIYLPSAVTNSGRVLKIVDVSGLAGTNNITITSPTAGNINGVASYVIDTDYEYVTVFSDGTNWFIIG